MARRMVFFFVAAGVIELDDEPATERRPALLPAAGGHAVLERLPLALVPDCAAIEARAVELVEAHDAEIELRTGETRRPRRAA